MAPDLPAPASALTAAQAQAANDFVRVILGRLRTDGGVHAETAISAAAGMAGMYLLRSLALPIDDLDAGTALLGEASDENRRALMATIVDTLAGADLRVDPAPVTQPVPADHLPQLQLLQVQLMFGVPYRKAVREHALSEREAAFASAVAAARIIKDCESVLEPQLALAIAARALAEGAMTVPLSLPGNDAGEPRKPWYKFW